MGTVRWEKGAARSLPDVHSFCRRKGNGGGDGVMFLQEQMPICVVQLVTVTSLSAGDMQGPSPYHDAGEQAHAFPAVGVWHHVSVANGEEGDGDKPHGPQEVAGHFLFIVVPRESREGWSARAGPSSFITRPGAVP